jgi:hypothetical protein
LGPVSNWEAHDGSTAESYATPTVAAAMAHGWEQLDSFFAPRRRWFGARALVRQACDGYGGGWDEQTGYGVFISGTALPSSVEPQPPVDWRVVEQPDGLLEATWLSFRAPQWTATRLIDDVGNVLYEGSASRADLERQSGQQTVIEALSVSASGTSAVAPYTSYTGPGVDAGDGTPDATLASSSDLTTFLGVSANVANDLSYYVRLARRYLIDWKGLSWYEGRLGLPAGAERRVEAKQAEALLTLYYGLPAQNLVFDDPPGGAVDLYTQESESGTLVQKGLREIEELHSYRVYLLGLVKHLLGSDVQVELDDETDRMLGTSPFADSGLRVGVATTE